ncbi:MAG: hypothetical protein E7177_07835 [Erysipelotrichaceae bacterium]|nr:hypothetical protein [Erysipelotrichaceae bacterium]
MEKKFEKFDLSKRFISMIKVDFRRMFTMPLYYLMVGISLVIPILILVMTTMFGGETEGMTSFSNVWKIIGSVSESMIKNSPSMSGEIDMLAMCNIDMMVFAVGVLVCLFINQDFKSGYIKNLFTVRSSKVDYVLSKTLVGFVCGSSMILAFFIGSMVGGKIANLSFDLPLGVNAINIVMCLICKLGVVLIFVPIFVIMGVVGKEKLWLSMIGSFGVSMLLFMMVSMIAPLNANFVNVILVLVGGVLFSVGLGSLSNLLLNKLNIL